MSDPEINKEQDAPDLEKVFTSLADKFKNSDGQPRISKPMLSVGLFLISIAMGILGFINYSKEVDIPKATLTEGQYTAVLHSESGKEAISTLNQDEVNWVQVRQHLKKDHIADFLITSLPNSGYECQNEQCIDIAFEDLNIKNGTRAINRDVAEFHRKIQAFTEGPLGMMLAFCALVIGGGLAVTRASPIPALAGIGMASFFSVGPQVVASVAVGGLPKQEAVAQVGHVSAIQGTLGSISKSSAALLASQFYAQNEDFDKLERLVDNIDISNLNVSEGDAKKLMQLTYTLDTTANGYITTQASAEYEQNFVKSVKKAEREGSFFLVFGGVLFVLSLLLQLSQVKTTSIRDVEIRKE